MRPLTDSLEFQAAGIGDAKEEAVEEHQRPSATCMFSLLQIGKCLAIENIWLSLCKYDVQDEGCGLGEVGGLLLFQDPALNTL